ncbi:MAG: CBS domain-containing protein [Sediminicola sp.]|jgi:CBS domain-containing protein
MVCTMFFDFNCLYGDKELVNEVSKSIFKSINPFEIFLNYLEQNAVLNPVPIFSRLLIAELDGAHKNQFDLKASALILLIDASRL